MTAFSKIPHRKILATCIAMALASSYAQAQQTTQTNETAQEIEEVIVTGSFIRGTPLDAPSPVQVVDRESIESRGAAVIWDVIKNLEINSGSFTEGGSGEVAATAGTAQVNLRNLGENSTLTLINGKRMVPSAALTRGGGEYVDLNSIPLVMTERVEILTDGGSAWNCMAMCRICWRPVALSTLLRARYGAGPAMMAIPIWCCRVNASKEIRSRLPKATFSTITP